MLKKARRRKGAVERLAVMTSGRLASILFWQPAAFTAAAPPLSTARLTAEHSRVATGKFRSASNWKRAWRGRDRHTDSAQFGLHFDKAALQRQALCRAGRGGRGSNHPAGRRPSTAVPAELGSKLQLTRTKRISSHSKPKPSIMVYYCNGYTSVYPCRNSGLGYGARAGIGVAIAAVIILILILVAFTARRRRRFAQQNSQTIPMSYPNNNNNQYYQGYNQGYNNGYPQASPYGQTQASPYGQPPAGQAYGPPSGAPPANNDDAALYAPPVGPPPPAYVPRDERKGAEANV
ncbi:hypothetical protein L1887_61631 [Cichorium endivia]|nr:hypothetical protein L1887_61631 [Cichorium endivia]